MDGPSQAQSETCRTDSASRRTLLENTSVSLGREEKLDQVMQGNLPRRKSKTRKRSGSFFIFFSVVFLGPKVAHRQL